MHQYEYLQIIKAENHVVTIKLNRPSKRNAIDSQMWKEIGQLFSEIGTNGEDYRCILLIGEGKSFCAGIDISDENFGLMEANASNESDVARRYISFKNKILEMQACLTAIEKCPIPVVCAIHGACIGGGIDLSCCADVRICSPDAKFSVREARLGLAADVGTLQRFPKICGHGSRVRELCLTGENFDAVEALRIGFVSRIESNLFESAMNVCNSIARNSPVAVQGTKLSLNYSRDHTVEEGLNHIAMHNAAALMTDDLIASVMAASGSESNFQNMLPMAKL